MKIPQSNITRTSGNLLVVAVVVMALMAVVLFSYLSMVGNQQKQTARSQAWNTCIALAEAGVEEALAHLNKNGLSTLGAIIMTNNLATEGWTFQNNTYSRKRQIDDGYFTVSILPGARPVITSTGYVPAPMQSASSGAAMFADLSPKPWNSGKTFLSRTVQVTVRSIGKFNKGIVAKDKVELNGKNVKVDSYHSYDPSASTYDGTNGWGLYDPAKLRANGDIAVMEGLHDDLNVNNAKVWGKVSTGPSGDIKANKNAVVGSVSWHAGGNKGVEPGWSSNDANFDMPAVTKPYNNGLIPTGGFIGTNYYNLIFYNGDYKVSQLKGKVWVAGKARVLVTSKIEFSDGATDDEGIELDTNAHFEIYMAGQEAKLVGKKNKKKNPLSDRVGFNSEGNTTNFLYFGLDKNVTLELKKMDDFYGIIYAPNAFITLKTGSPKYYHCDVYGSIQGLKVKLEKNVTLHYDENIGSLPADSYVIESWKEL